jgi:hypothetical protein
MGGLGGHIKHIYENHSIRFSDIYNFYDALLSGNIEANKVSIKIDGINIFFTMNKNGDVLIARNKSQLAKPIISDNDIIEHFKDLKNIANAFIYAKNLIEQFIKPDYFDDGRIWISADIVYRKALNLIIYDDDFLTLHTKNYVDENYKIIKKESQKTI